MERIRTTTTFALRCLYKILCNSASEKKGVWIGTSINNAMEIEGLNNLGIEFNESHG